MVLTTLALLGGANVALAQDTQFFSGDTTEGPLWTPPAGQEFEGNYEATTFTVSTTGAYTIEADYRFDEPVDWWDGYLYLYEAPFDPLNPSLNLITQDDDYLGSFTVLSGTTTSSTQGSRIDSVNLQAGVDYVLIIGAWATGFGEWQAAVGPASESGPELGFCSSGATLDCGGLDPVACDAVNLLGDTLAEAPGVPPLDDEGPTRFRPTRIYDRMAQLHAHAEDQDCVVYGYTLGLYDSSDAAQFLLGDAIDGDTCQDYLLGGYVTRPPKRWEAGVFFPDESSEPIGDRYGTYNAQGQMAGNVGVTGFTAGTWIRVVGSRGIFLTAIAECSGPSEFALQDWYRGDLGVEGGIDLPPIIIDGPGGEIID